MHGILSLAVIPINIHYNPTMKATEAQSPCSPVGSGSGLQQSSPVCGLSVWVKQSGRWQARQPAAWAGVGRSPAPEVCKGKSQAPGWWRRTMACGHDGLLGGGDGNTVGHC